MNSYQSRVDIKKVKKIQLKFVYQIMLILELVLTACQDHEMNILENEFKHSSDLEYELLVNHLASGITRPFL